jgi:hypothetical protein
MSLQDLNFCFVFLQGKNETKQIVSEHESVELAN